MAAGIITNNALDLRLNLFYCMISNSVSTHILKIATGLLHAKHL